MPFPSVKIGDIAQKQPGPDATVDVAHSTPARARLFDWEMAFIKVDTHTEVPVSVNVGDTAQKQALDATVDVVHTTSAARLGYVPAGYVAAHLGAHAGARLCTNACVDFLHHLNEIGLTDYDGDGACDDGGEGSDWGACSYGTDCDDCGSRPPLPARGSASSAAGVAAAGEHYNASGAGHTGGAGAAYGAVGAGSKGGAGVAGGGGAAGGYHQAGGFGPGYQQAKGYGPGGLPIPPSDGVAVDTLSMMSDMFGIKKMLTPPPPPPPDGVHQFFGRIQKSAGETLGNFGMGGLLDDPPSPPPGVLQKILFADAPPAPA